MYQSLCVTLGSLPNPTRVFCRHEVICLTFITMCLVLRFLLDILILFNYHFSYVCFVFSVVSTGYSTVGVLFACCCAKKLEGFICITCKICFQAVSSVLSHNMHIQPICIYKFRLIVWSVTDSGWVFFFNQRWSLL